MAKQNEMRLCIFLAEHCLYLLWAHLDFYMLRAVSVNALQFNQSKSFTEAGFSNNIDIQLSYANAIRNSIYVLILVSKSFIHNTALFSIQDADENLFSVDNHYAFFSMV